MLRLAAASSGDFFKWFIFGKQWPSQLLWHSWRWSAFQHRQKIFILFAVVSSTLNGIEPCPCNFVSSKLNRKDEPSLSAHYKWPFSLVISKLAEVVSCMLGFRRLAEAWKFWCFRPPAGAPEAPEALAVQLLQIHSSSSMLLRNSYLPYQKGGQVKCFETMQNLWNSLEGGWFCWYRYRKYECLIHTHRTCSDCLLVKSGTTSPAFRLESLSQNLWIGFEKYEIQNTCSPIVESGTVSPT